MTRDLASRHLSLLFSVLDIARLADVTRREADEELPPDSAVPSIGHSDRGGEAVGPRDRLTHHRDVASVAQAGEEKPFSVRALTFSCAISGVLSIRSLSESRTPPIDQSVSLRRIVWPAECNTLTRMRWAVVAMVVMLNSA